MDKAREMLGQTTNPILDYARLGDAVDGYGPVEDRQRILEKTKALRSLGPMESQALDGIYIDKNSNPNYQVERVASAGPNLDWWRTWADRDPYNPQTVLRYLGALEGAEQFLNQKWDRDEAIVRLKKVLTKTPYADRIWSQLGQLIAFRNGYMEIDLDSLAAAEPYFINGMVYSNYDYDSLSTAISTKAGALVKPSSDSKKGDISGLSPAERARLDEVFNCPLLRQMRMLSAACYAQGIPEAQCGGFPEGPDAVMKRLQDVVAQGSCKKEMIQSLENLPYSPVRVDLTRPVVSKKSD